MSARLSTAVSVVLSTVMGILGSLIINIERRPTNISRSAETTIIIRVHIPVFRIIFVSRSLLMAVIAVKKISGTTM